MNESMNAFERELASFEPAGTSDELVQSIGRTLDERTLTTWPIGAIRRIGLAATACAVLAGSVVWLASFGPDEPTDSRPVSLAEIQQMPTALAYHMTMQRSFDELDDLLDRHGRRVLPASGPALRVGPSFVAPDPLNTREVSP